MHFLPSSTWNMYIKISFSVNIKRSHHLFSGLGHYRIKFPGFWGLVPASLNLQSNIGDAAELYVNNLQSPKALDVEYKR